MVSEQTNKLTFLSDKIEMEYNFHNTFKTKFLFFEMFPKKKNKS